jgi:hypothetical protein
MTTDFFSTTMPQLADAPNLKMAHKAAEAPR